MGCTTARSHLLPSLLALAASDFSSVAAVPLVLRRTSAGSLMGFRSVFGAFIAAIRGGFGFPCGSVAESLTLDGRDHSLDYKISGLTYPKGSGMDGLLRKLRLSSSSVFISTHIDYILRNLGVRQLIIWRLIADRCAQSAIRDACLTCTQERHDHSVRTIKGFSRQASAKELVAGLA